MKNTKFQLIISKIMLARQKQSRDMGCEYHCSNDCQLKIEERGAVNILSPS